MIGSSDVGVDVKDTADLEDTEKEEYEVYSAKICDYLSEINPDIFFPDDSDYKEMEDEEDYRRWKDKNGNYLLCEAGRITYFTEEYSEVYSDLMFSEYGKYLEGFEEIFGESKAGEEEYTEVEEKILSLLDNNDITVSNMNIYYLTADNLEELSKMAMSDEEYEEELAEYPSHTMKRVFDESDEVYVISMDVMMEDKVLYTTEYHSGTISYPGSKVHAVYDSNLKLVSLEADGIYQKVGEVGKITVISPEEAKQKFKERYTDIISEQTVELKELTISYIPIRDEENKELYSVIPVYVLNVEITQDMTEIGKGVSSYTDTILLDAELGNWVE